MKTYSIIAKTNSYIAQRDAQFDGNTSIVISSGLNLKEAHRMLLDMYNTKYEGERPYAANWGMAVIQSAKHSEGASGTNPDGTRGFDYDSRKFCIEEETTEEYLITPEGIIAHESMNR